MTCKNKKCPEYNTSCEEHCGAININSMIEARCPYMEIKK